MKTRWFFLLVLALSVGAAMAQNEIWARRYNGPGNHFDRVAAMALDTAGNVHVTGPAYPAGSQTNQNYVTIKYSPDGNELWLSTFSLNDNDYPSAIAVDTSGNVYVSGSSGTVKYNSAGAQQWNRQPGGAIALDALGNIVIVGSSASEAALWKYSPNGTLQWARTFDAPGTGSDGLSAVAIDATGSVYAAGIRNRVHDEAASDFLVVKFTSAGAYLWDGFFAGAGNLGDWAAAIELDNNGNPVVAGNANVDAFSPAGDVAVAEFNRTTGVESWHDVYDGPDHLWDAAADLAMDSAGNSIVAGYTEKAATGSDYLTIKNGPGGARLWARTFDGGASAFDTARGVTVDQADRVYVTGGAVRMAGQAPDYCTVKYEPNGPLKWVRRYDGPADDLDEASSVLIDWLGNVLMAGESYGVGTVGDFATVKVGQSMASNVSTISVGPGVLESGSFFELLSSDSQYLVCRPGIVFNNSIPPLQITVEGTATPETTSLLSFRVEGHTTSTNIVQRIYLFNFETDEFVLFDTANTTLSDSVREVAVGGTSSEYIQFITRRMRAKITYKTAGPVFSFPWRARLDHVAWGNTP
ncbi:MAG: SBBP repeat-containing protein [Armatimonadetes bacterium]|nr:SBBP repeat-containing protein [Armatimonadota bacterium]